MKVLRIRLVVLAVLIAIVSLGHVEQLGSSASADPLPPWRETVLVPANSPTPIGGTFRNLDGGKINNFGHVAFRASVEELSQPTFGIFVWRNGTIGKVVTQGDPAPGGGQFTNFGCRIELNDNDDIAFEGYVGLSAAIYLFELGTGLTKVVGLGDNTPLGGTYGSSFTCGSFGLPNGRWVVPAIDLNNSREITFGAPISNGTTLTGGAIFLWSSGNVVPVVALGQDKPSGGKFEFISANSITSEGSVLFWSGFPNSGSEIFRWNGGALSRLAGYGDALPVGTSIITICGYGAAKAGLGQKLTLLVNPSYQSTLALFKLDSGVFTKIAASGDILPDGEPFDGGRGLEECRNPQINSAGNVAFTGGPARRLYFSSNGEITIPNATGYTNEPQLNDADQITYLHSGGDIRLVERGPTTPQGQIAFKRGLQGGLWTMAADGSGKSSLTESFEPQMPIWSRDASKVAFVSETPGVAPCVIELCLGVVDANGTNVRYLAPAPGWAGGAAFGGIGVGHNDPSWSPNGQTIAYTSLVAQPDGSSKAIISVIGTDGSNQRDVTEGGLPSWSPDGSLLAYACPGTYDVCLTDLTGNSRVLYHHDRGTFSLFSWSPDGSRVGFSASTGLGGESSDAFWVDVASGQAHNITQNYVAGYVKNTPVWSPDGAKIAVSEASGEIQLFDSNGENRRILTNNGALEGTQVWSPDSQWVTFTRTPQPWQVMIARADGTEIRNLTNNATVSELVPAWSPTATEPAPRPSPTPNPPPTPEPPRKVIVFLQGITSQLSGGRESAFDSIKNRFKLAGYTDSDFLEYSYKGVLITNKAWAPLDYSCGDTLQDIFGASAGKLHDAIRLYKQAHPSTSFVLVGHSLGGLVALQELNQVLSGSDAPGTIDSIIMLDSPLNGVSSNIVANIGTVFDTCKFPSGEAAREVIALGNSPNTRSLNNAVVKAAQAKGTRVITLGSRDDCVWKPRACHIPVKGDQTTQIIRSAIAKKLYSLDSSGCLTCFGSSHGAILANNLTVIAIACVSGTQLPSTQPSAGDTRACLK